MELHIWKQLLLKWVNECNFIQYITSIEDLNIDAFYKIYVTYVEKPAEKSPPVNSTFSLETFNIFLKDIYPEFVPNCDHDGRVMRSDYIYVLTLFMHYTCIKNPSKHFHNICKNLPETVQQYIAAFFQQTVNRPELTRKRLQQAIVNVGNEFENSCLFPVPKLSESSANTDRCRSSRSTLVDVDDSIDDFNSFSDNETGKSHTVGAKLITKPVSLTSVQQDLQSAYNVNQICSPQTPKGELLEQRTRELFGLRAQLETERYEKTLLEEQILENKNLIDSLSNENSFKEKQLAVLKDKLRSACNSMEVHVDNCAPVEFDNFKRQIMKELNNKEAEFTTKCKELQELRAEYAILVNKLNLSEERLVMCMDRFTELELNLHKTENLLSYKEKEVAYLLNEKLELQQCLQETRNEHQNGKEVLDASSDFLNNSQLHSSMNTPPENLGTCVIDKQLREKEQENNVLREKLAQITKEKSDIRKELLQLVFKFQLEISTTSDVSQLQLLQLIRHHIEKSLNCEQEQQRANELQAKNNTILCHNIINEDRLNIKLTENESGYLNNNKTMIAYDRIVFNFPKICKDFKIIDKEFFQIRHQISKIRFLNHCMDLHIQSETANYNEDHFLHDHQLEVQTKKKNYELTDRVSLKTVNLQPTQRKQQQLFIIQSLNKNPQESMLLNQHFKDPQEHCLQNIEQRVKSINETNNQQINSEFNVILSRHTPKNIEYEKAQPGQESQLELLSLGLKNRIQWQEQLLFETNKRQNIRELLEIEEKKCHVLESQLKRIEVVYPGVGNYLRDAFFKKDVELQKIQSLVDLANKRIEEMSNKLDEQQSAFATNHREVTLIEKRASRAENELLCLERLHTSEETKRKATQDRLTLLEKSWKDTDKKRRNLELHINVIESDIVRLCLEVEGLNSDIRQYQNRTAELSAQLQLVSGVKSLVKNCNAEPLKEEQSATQKLNVTKLQLSEVQQELDGTRSINESIQRELDEKINQLKIQREKTIEREAQYRRKLNNLKKELFECNAELTQILENRNILLDTLHKSEKQNTQQIVKAQQLELDCQVLQAKYRDAKEEICHFEQKLKEQRFEMEGKLEKMKIKMRTLYMEEVTRMKKKQERDATRGDVELKKFNTQNTKYEEHTRKLSNQIVRLNEKILEQQKQYAVLKTKLRHIQDADLANGFLKGNKEWNPFKNSIDHSSNQGSNLAMEDEEGEVFNNTYLADLKMGHMANMTAEELQYRNSLQPPHLKSTYAAQYDLTTQEADLKDDLLGPNDSTCTLLNIKEESSAGTRKKCIGTNYKRPGPPTPSKNGGRSSVVSSEPPREVLHESSNINHSTVKTPARFKMFASRFSLGSNGISAGSFFQRDENSPPKRRLSNMFKRK